LKIIEYWSRYKKSRGDPREGSPVLMESGVDLAFLCLFSYLLDK